jgi:hypothetical protein
MNSKSEFIFISSVYHISSASFEEKKILFRQFIHYNQRKVIVIRQTTTKKKKKVKISLFNFYRKNNTKQKYTFKSCII